MIFSYNWLQSFFKPAFAKALAGKQKLPKPEKLAELLTMHSFEVKEVKKTDNDWVLDIDVLPNRASDCFSHAGVAKEISAITGLIYRGLTSIIREDKRLKAKDFVNIEVKDKKSCLRYTAGVVIDVKVSPSPKWIQDRLRVCGLRPINNVVDIVNYVMLEMGQPIHAFDFEKIESVNPKSLSRIETKFSLRGQIKRIIIRKAEKGEKITTLDDEKYGLDEDILIIADSKGPLAIAGIKGGKKAEIDNRTKTVVLESANFYSRTIRLASKKLDLKTDASIRFEHGLDPNLTELAINRAVYLIQEIASGKITQGLIDFYPRKVLPKIIKTETPKREVIKILKSLDFKIRRVSPSQIEVEVPTRRLDVSIFEDLTEEFIRIYGYEKISAKFPVAVLIPTRKNDEIFWENLSKNILKETSFSEVYNYSFISDKDAKTLAYLSTTSDIFEVENPTSADFKYLRPSLIPNLLKNVFKNQKNFEEIKIFELGKTFVRKQKIKNEERLEEKKMLAGALTGDRFFEAKGAVDSLLNKLGISNVWYDEYQPTPEDSKISIWHPKRCAEIKIDGEEIGFLGEISPKILDSYKIENKVVLFDIDFDKLQKYVSEEHEFRPISPYPAAVRDIAILVPLSARVEEVLNKIELAGGSLVRDVDLFDIYEGEELPGGKKNLAFHIIYQAEDHTLASGEIDEIHGKIIKAIEEEAEWEVRR